MIQGIPALITSLGNLAGKIIDNATLKDAVEKSANLLNWCYREIKRLQQIVFSVVAENKKLKKRLSKYEKI